MPTYPILFVKACGVIMIKLWDDVLLRLYPEPAA